MTGTRDQPRLVGLLTLAAGVSYVAATALGVAMRFQYTGVSVPVPFDHLLHAHSHTLYFGWAGLAILAGGISATERRRRSMKVAAAVLLASPPALLIGFTALGYHPVTIAISTIVMLVWYVVIVAWWLSARGYRTTGHTALRAAMGYLVVASVGVWVLAGLRATGRGTVLAESLAVHAFVGGFGWFMVLGVVGLMATNAGRLDIHFEDATIRTVIRWWVPLAWLTFPLGVAGGPETQILGPLSRFAGLALLVPAWLWVRTLWNACPGRAAPLWRMASAWFALSSLTLASVAVLGSQVLLLGGRQAVVIHLHALLVGFVTGSLALIGLDGRSGVAIRVHHGALAAMLVGLLGAQLGAMRPGMWLAAGGAVVLWCAGVVWVMSYARLTKQSSEPPLSPARQPDDAGTVLGATTDGLGAAAPEGRPMRSVPER